jgi:hypothetical protein
MARPIHRLLQTLGGSPSLRYTHKVKALAPFAYWPLADSGGSVAVDASGNGRDGVYTSTTLGVTGIGDGRTAAAFDGTASRVNVYSASLDAAFNNAEFTIAGWFQVSAAGDWTDATNRVAMHLGVDTTNNYTRILKSSTSNLLVPSCVAGGTSDFVNVSSFSPTAWFHVALTRSVAADQLKVYVNGAQSGTTQTGMGTWAGALSNTRCVLGAQQTTPSLLWKGNIAHAAVWARPLTAAEVASLAVVG